MIITKRAKANKHWLGCKENEIAFPPASRPLTKSLFISLSLYLTGITLRFDTNIFSKYTNRIVNTKMHSKFSKINLFLKTKIQDFCVYYVG